MGVSTDQIQAQAPTLVSLTKEITVHLNKNGLNPETNKAAVLVTIDKSGSTQNLYATGVIQKVTDLAVAAGLVFDDDGDVPVSFFQSRIDETDVITLANATNYIANKRPRVGGGTSYIAALKWIIEEAGYGNVNLGGGMFHKAQEAKATAEYPTFAIFITDGEPSDPHDEIEKLLTRMSQLPIFVLFLGVTDDDSVAFSFLNSLDEMEGRFIDNAGFFDSREASNQQEMLKGLLDEFSKAYYPNARKQGLISATAKV
jgi:hypothetical protein